MIEHGVIFETFIQIFTLINNKRKFEIPNVMFTF